MGQRTGRADVGKEALSVYLHPDTDLYPVRVFAHQSELYWCQRAPLTIRRSVAVNGGTAEWPEQHGVETRIGVLGTDEPAREVPGLREAAEAAGGN